MVNTLAISGAVGQIFIFFTISMHNCHTLTIITTSRKCLSVVMSAIAFAHPFTPMQWVGVTMVLGSTVTEVITGKMRKDAEAEAKKKKVVDEKKEN
jgi:UDP-galactose transporter B1